MTDGHSRIAALTPETYCQNMCDKLSSIDLFKRSLKTFLFGQILCQRIRDTSRSGADIRLKYDQRSFASHTCTWWAKKPDCF